METSGAMAEGTAKEADAGAAEVVSSMEDPTPEQVAGDAQIDVRPKELEGLSNIPQNREEPAAGEGPGLVVAGDWWRSSSPLADTGAPLRTPKLFRHAFDKVARAEADGR